MIMEKDLVWNANPTLFSFSGENREMTRFKLENPGLRQSQLKQLIYKAFQKSPENPFNQANVMAYNATQDDVRDLKGKKRTKHTILYVLVY